MSSENQADELTNEEHKLLVFARLAKISHQKQQLPSRDRFLVLAGEAACRSALVRVAEQCRELVLANNPHHLLGRYASFADAMRSEEFNGFVTQLERFCSFEQGEHLLAEMGIHPVQDWRNSESSLGEYTSQFLQLE